jgi:hypothetical protein
MGKCVFVTYKYGDTLVSNLDKKEFKIIGGQLQYISRQTRVRDYVDILQDKIGKDHMNLGEKDGESLEQFSDEKIESELKKKIYRSSVTIVMISKGMKEPFKNEREQWIPWEVSYSLRVVKREDSTSQMNAVLGIVLPDNTGSYDWYYTSNPNCNSITHHTTQLFKILKDNMFNVLEKEFRECNGTQIHIKDEPSFIKTLKWDDFINGNNYNFYVDKATEIKDDADSYDVHVNLD